MLISSKTINPGFALALKLIKLKPPSKLQQQLPPLLNRKLDMFKALLTSKLNTRRVDNTGVPGLMPGTTTMFPFQLLPQQRLRLLKPRLVLRQKLAPRQKPVLKLKLVLKVQKPLKPKLALKVRLHLLKKLLLSRSQSLR